MNTLIAFIFTVSIIWDIDSKTPDEIEKYIFVMITYLTIIATLELNSIKKILKDNNDTD